MGPSSAETFWTVQLIREDGRVFYLRETMTVSGLYLSREDHFALAAQYETKKEALIRLDFHVKAIRDRRETGWKRISLKRSRLSETTHNEIDLERVGI